MNHKSLEPEQRRNRRLLSGSNALGLSPGGSARATKSQRKEWVESGKQIEANKWDQTPSFILNTDFTAICHQQNQHQKPTADHTRYYRTDHPVHGLISDQQTNSFSLSLSLSAALSPFKHSKNGNHEFIDKLGANHESHDDSTSFPDYFSIKNKVHSPSHRGTAPNGLRIKSLPIFQGQIQCNKMSQNVQWKSNEPPNRKRNKRQHGLPAAVRTKHSHSH